MFRIHQIVTANRFMRSFREIAEHLAKCEEPILITQKTGRFLVVMDAEFFEGVLQARDSVGRELALLHSSPRRALNSSAA